MLDAIIVIAQYARDQAMGSARDQAAKVSLRRLDHYSGFITPCNSHKSVKRHPCLIWKVLLHNFTLRDLD